MSRTTRKKTYRDGLKKALKIARDELKWALNYYSEECGGKLTEGLRQNSRAGGVLFGFKSTVDALRSELKCTFEEG